MVICGSDARQATQTGVHSLKRLWHNAELQLALIRARAGLLDVLGVCRRLCFRMLHLKHLRSRRQHAEHGGIAGTLVACRQLPSQTVLFLLLSLSLCLCLSLSHCVIVQLRSSQHMARLVSASPNASC
jgi:hypothetical protein